MLRHCSDFIVMGNLCFGKRYYFRFAGLSMRRTKIFGFSPVQEGMGLYILIIIS